MRWVRRTCRCRIPCVRGPGTEEPVVEDVEHELDIVRRTTGRWSLTTSNPEQGRVRERWLPCGGAHPGVAEGQTGEGDDDGGVQMTG